MNKTKIGLIATVFASAIALTSCNKYADVNKISFSKEIIDNNLKTEDSLKYPDHPSMLLNNDMIYNYNVVSEKWLDIGLLVVSNYAGNIGFYSLVYGDLIVKCSYNPKLLNYEVIKKDIGYFIVIRYKDDVLVVDNNGNVLLDEIEQYETNSDYPITIETFTRQEKNYVRISYKDIRKSFVYSGGKVTKIDDYLIPQEDEQKVEIDNTQFKIGDLYTLGEVDLTLFGKPDYKIQTNKNLATVYDENHVFVSQFILPREAKFFNGSKVLYQEIHKLPDDSQKYDFFANGTKQNLSTFAIDIFNGETSLLDFPYLIENVSNAKDKNGFLTYGVALLTHINSSKTLDRSCEYLLDKDFKLVSNFAQAGGLNYIKTQNGNYYNTSTQTLYNSMLKPITNFDSLNNVTYDSKNNIFIAYYMNGKIGLLDESGKILCDFKYSEIIKSYADDGLMLVDRTDRTISRYTTFGVNKFIVYKAYRIIDPYYGKILCVDDRNRILYIDGHNIVDTFLTLPDNIFDIYTSDFDIKTAFAGTVAKITTSSQNLYFCFARDFNKWGFNSVGENSYKKENLGQTEDDAIPLTLGSQKIFTPKDEYYSYTYFSFVPNMSDTYLFTTNVNARLYGVKRAGSSSFVTYGYNGAQLEAQSQYIVMFNGKINGTVTVSRG